jgi:membrane protein YqaA with SNARE-associated domain
MATNSSKYKLTGVNGSEIQISLNGPTGPTGPANVLEIGDVTTAETGVPAAASITGSSPSQLLHLTLPKGNTGTAATIAVGTTATGAAGSSASVTNGGSSSAAVFNFTIPKGDKGNTGTLSLGTVATGNAGTDVIITNTGTPEAGEFNFTIPRGNTGATGPATQLSVASTSTGSAGSDASVTISGTAPVQSLAFTIPRGDTGQTGPATQLSVASTTTGAAGTNASVTISGTAPVQSLAFTIPQGIQGIQGETGSSGATALLTGYVSGAGTVAATDTVIQAVGKLNGNDELKASIASLYPYIGGKLLTYLDEEAAIADPLISAGDIYRKSAGGVDYVNPDNVPSLDLRFATDKTLTARRGPTPTFSRASSGTFVNANGLIVGKTAGTTSSITPNTQAIGSQVTVTVASGSVVGWVVGQAISLIVDTDGQDDPDATELWLLGNIVSTTDTTLVFSVTSRTTQAGSATSWTLGYRGPRFDHDPVSRTNLLTRSAEFENSAWSRAAVGVAAATITPNSDIAPDGTTTADTANFSATTATNQQGMLFRTDLTATIGQVVTFSVYMRVPSGTATVYIELAEGSPVSGQSVACNVTTTWQRFSITRTAVAATQIYTQIGPDTRSFAGQPAVQPAASVFIWGAQLEAGSTATSYIPTTTASVTIHDCRGLLIEEGRTNLLSRSEEFNETAWLKLRSSISANSTVSPSGDNSADKLVEDSSAGTHMVYRVLNTGSLVAHTFSVFAKADGRNFVYLNCGDGFPLNSHAYFNLSNGTLGTIGANATASITAFGNGWYRCSVTATPTSTTTNGFYIQTASANGTISYQGDGTSGIFIWGAQVEAGSFPTSYIPTTTGTLARGADVCSITGGAFTGMWNQSEGTLLAQTQKTSTNINAFVISVSDNSFNNETDLRYSSVSQLQALINVSNVTQVPAFQANISSGAVVKQSIAYKLNDCAYAANGASPISDTSALIPTVDRLAIGNVAFVGQALYLNGHIASVRYYKKRLPDAKIQALTV